MLLFTEPPYNANISAVLLITPDCKLVSSFDLHTKSYYELSISDFLFTNALATSMSNTAGFLCGNNGAHYVELDFVKRVAHEIRLKTIVEVVDALYTLDPRRVLMVGKYSKLASSTTNRCFTVIVKKVGKGEFCEEYAIPSPSYQRNQIILS